MEKKWLKRAILSAVLGSSFLGILPSVEAAEVRILPVDRAKFWAGAKFDFDVEVKGDQQLKDVDITVNGQPAEKFFGRKLVKKDLGNGGHQLPGRSGHLPQDRHLCRESDGPGWSRQGRFGCRLYGSQ